MNTTKQAQTQDLKPQFPSLATIQQELGTAKSIDDFFGKQGILTRLFSSTLETMLEAELTEHLGYERYEAKGTLRVPEQWPQPQWQTTKAAAHLGGGYYAPAAA